MLPSCTSCGRCDGGCRRPIDASFPLDGCQPATLKKPALFGGCVINHTPYIRPDGWQNVSRSRPQQTPQPRTHTRNSLTWCTSMSSILISIAFIKFSTFATRSKNGTLWTDGIKKSKTSKPHTYTRVALASTTVLRRSVSTPRCSWPRVGRRQHKTGRESEIYSV